MKTDNCKESFYSISLSDIYYLCHRLKKKIFFSILMFVFLGALYTLAKPVLYNASGTFREKNTSSSAVNSPLASLLVMGGANTVDSEAVALMKSRKLMEPVIQKLGLQGLLSNNGVVSDTYLRRIKNNLNVSYAYLRRSLFPAVLDIRPDLIITNIFYDAETPSQYRLIFLSEDSYQLKSGKTVIGEGKLGSPFAAGSLQFLLNRSTDKIVIGHECSLTFLPMSFVMGCVLNNLKIELDKKDQRLLRLDFIYHDRYFASHLLNEVMWGYQNYLKVTHDLQAEIQLGYLKRRRQESSKELESEMNRHAETLSEGLTNTGFIDSNKKMQFLAENQQKYKERLLSNELEIKRLESFNERNLVYYDHYSLSNVQGDPQTINKILTSIRELKQQRDDLDLTLKSTRNQQPAELQQIFNSQMDELNSVRQSIGEIRKIISWINLGTPLELDLKLLSDPKYIVNSWLNKLSESERKWKDTLEEKENFKQNLDVQKNNFISYLINLERIFLVYEKIIQERLTHQQNPSLEFQGISLQTSADLFITYSEQLNKIEADMRQNDFIIERIQDPGFEISSLSHLLDDQVIKEMVNRSVGTLLSLRDEHNRSLKEQERLHEELDLQRDFLILHISQTNNLLKLKEALWKEKIQSLRSVSFELIHQQISLLEKSLEDYITSRLQNLKEERKIIEKHLHEINEEMALLPKKWTSEKLIEQSVTINRHMVEEISKMVESKNITHHLELIQSAPVDLAIPPIHPRSPRLLFHIILWGLLGTFFSLSATILYTVFNGMPASAENLKYLKQHVSGQLSENFTAKNSEPLLDGDLETLRHVVSFFEEVQQNSKATLLIQGKEIDYSNSLAALISKKGSKVLLIELSLEKTASSNQLPGLLQFLEGKAEQPSIIKHQSFDMIYGGGASRFSVELLGKKIFEGLLKKLQSEYDWIIGVTTALPESAEVQSLLPCFKNIAVTISNQKLDELEAYFNLSQLKRVTFLISKVSFLPRKNKVFSFAEGRLKLRKGTSWFSEKSKKIDKSKDILEMSS